MLDMLFQTPLYLSVLKIIEATLEVLLKYNYRNLDLTIHFIFEHQKSNLKEQVNKKQGVQFLST